VMPGSSVQRADNVLTKARAGSTQGWKHTGLEAHRLQSTMHKAAK
jgi:hypothetical protein